MELEQGVVLLCPGLSGEHVHAVSGHGDGEVAAGGRTLPRLHHLLPPLPAPAHEADGPHVVQPRVTVIPSKYPQLTLVHGSPVSRPRHGFTTSLVGEALTPLTSGKFVFPEVVSVGQVGV